jgi:diacylglycerol kinase (ATP)
VSDELLVVANPSSGRGRSVKIANQFVALAEESGVKSTLVALNGEDLMLAAIEQHLQDRKWRGIIAVGGDGLLHSLLPIVKEHGLPFTVIPAGTGNDFAREIGSKRRSLKQNLNRILDQPTQIDSFTVKSPSGIRHGAQVLSLGFDALVNERANAIKSVRGKAKYVVAMVRELPVFKPMHFSITVDGVSYEREAMLIAIANGPSYGGGMLICPGADHADGVLDVLILNRVSTLDLLKVFPKVYLGKHITHPAVEIIRGKHIVVDAQAKAFADGEFVGDLPVEIQVEPGSLRVWK